MPSLPILLLCLSLGVGQEPDAETALQKLLQETPANSERLRQELLAFRQEYSGTPPAVKAAAMLARLPSPLDQLEAAQIPELERFDWQPRDLVAVLQEHRGRHGAAVNTVAVTPDGQRIISGGGSALVRFWDAATMRLQEVVGASSAVLSATVSPDGQTLAVGCADGMVHLWDIRAQPAMNHASLRTAARGVYSLAFAPGGKRLAVGTGDGHVHVWDGPWEKPPTEPATSHIGPTQPIFTLAFTPDGKTLVAGSHDGELKLYDPKAVPLKVRLAMQVHAQGVRAAAFEPTAKEQPLLASAGMDGKLCFWRFGAAKPKLENMLTSKSGPILALAFSSDGRSLAYAAGDQSVRLLTVKGRQERAALKGHAGAIKALAITGKGDKGLHVFSGSIDWTVRRWDDLASSKPGQKTVTAGHLSAAYAAAFAPGYRALVTGSDDSTLRVWDVAASAPREKIILPSPVKVYTAAYFPDGQKIAAAGNGVEAQVWDLATRKIVLHLQGHERAIGSIAVAPDGKQVLTGSTDKTMRLWDASTGLERRRFTGYTAAVNAVAFAPDGRRVASGSGDYLYDEKNQLVVKDGQLQYADCTVRLWTLPDGAEPVKMIGHTRPIYAVAVAPTGKELASGGLDLTLRRWNAAGKELQALPLQGAVHSLALSADDQLVATAGSDAKVLVHERASGKLLHTWQMRETPRRVAFAADSRHLAVTFDTGVAYILRLAGPAAANSQ